MNDKKKNSAIFWGRFGGLNKRELAKLNLGNVFYLSYEPSAILNNGLTIDGDMSIIQLLSRAWDAPRISLEHLKNYGTESNLLFRNGPYYVIARMLYEHHFKRHFIRFGWIPATNNSLETFNINAEFIGHLLNLTHPTYILFETPPHNCFDTLLYFMARTKNIPCYVARDNGYLGGFRLFLNPLDSWPTNTFSQLIAPPSELIQNYNDSHSMQADLAIHTKSLHDQLHTFFFPGKFQIFKTLAQRARSQFVRSSANYFDPTKSNFSQTSEVWKSISKIFENRGDFQYEYFPSDIKVSRAIKTLSRSSLFTREILQAKSIDLKMKYVYFSHAFQPEQTTSLLGLQYEDHYLFLIELLRVLPDDVQIYIRDYPLHDWPNSLPRNVSKWKDLEMNPRISFAPQDVSVIDLIENAIATALVNGSAGYESLLNLKPVIYGGIPDYAGLPGTVPIDQLILGGPTAFSRWHQDALDLLSSFEGTPSAILRNITISSFAGWVSLTETIPSEAIADNAKLIGDFLIWLDSLDHSPKVE